MPAIVYFLLVLSVLLAVSVGISKEETEDLFNRQDKLAGIFARISSGLGPADNENHPFLFNSTQLYQDSSVLETFLKTYKRGLTYKYGVYTINSPKCRKDTRSFFDLLYFAKDFDTFYKISEWGLNELHRMEFGLAFTAAVLHREDTRGLYVPPLYEVFPDYFVPAEIMHRANIAKMMGHNSKVFQVNNTGYEWTWYRELFNGPTKQSVRWNGDDVNSRLSYFREDVSLAQNLMFIWMKLGGWLDAPKYDLHFFKGGERIYNYFNFVLIRYNLERISNGLNPIEPLNHDAPIKDGYNPGLTDIAGWKLAMRPNNLVPSRVNPEGIESVREAESRLSQLIDMGQIKNMKTNEVLKLDESNGLDYLAEIVFGRASAISLQYYKPLFITLLGAYDGMLKSANDITYNPGTLGSIMTAFRDPVFYRILATVMKHFDHYNDLLPPYSKEKLSFPGVEIDSVEISEMMTTFDRHNFSINNGVEGANSKQYNMIASQLRLNVKPFTYKIKIKSSVDALGYIKIFIGPKLDALGKSIPLNKARKLFYLLDSFTYEVAAGDNTIESNSLKMDLWSDSMDYEEYRKQEDIARRSNQFFFTPESLYCRLPRNLMLPRGWKQGREFRTFIIILPAKRSHYREGYFPCQHVLYYDGNTELTPFDRSLLDEDSLIGSNMLLKEITFYNEF